MAEMTAEQAAEWGKTLSFEKVWALFAETDRKFAESAEQIKEVGRKQVETDEQMKVVEQKLAEAAEQSKETDRKLAEAAEQMKVVEQKQAEAAEQSKETDRKLAESAEQIAKVGREQAETSKQIKKLSINIGGVNRTLGRWSEEMVAAKLCEKINLLGYEFTRCSRNTKYWENGKKLAELDCFLENGDFVMIVETKTDLTVEDVEEYLEKIEKIRNYMDKRGDKRIIVGAVAGAIVPVNVCRYAHKKGLYVLVQSGKSIIAADMPETFQPRKW